jgi:pectinesterase
MMGISGRHGKWRMVRCAALVPLLLTAVAANAGAQMLRLTITNPEPFARSGEIVSLPRNELAKHLSSFDAAALSVSTVPEGAAVPIQITDDALLLLVDIPAGRSREYLLSPGVSTPARFAPRVDGRFVLPRQDYAWENDRIAFRVYGPALAAEVANGIDVWTKRVRSLIVAKWYRESEESPPGGDSYHVDRGEGADFFSVGRSLGAGAAALWSGGRLHQPGVFSSWRTIANGPLRVQFELIYDSLWVSGVLYSERCRVTLDAGSNLNRIEVTYFGGNASDELLVACGLVKRPGTSARNNVSEGWLSLWGATTADTTNGELGTGIVLLPPVLEKVTEDSMHYLVLGRTVPGTVLAYYAGAGWTRSGDFGTAEDWEGYLSRFSRAIRSPLRYAVTLEGK